MKTVIINIAILFSYIHAIYADVPVVSTDSITHITATQATIYGNVVSDGGFPVTERGIVFSHTITNPAIGNGIVVSCGSGTGTFSGFLSNLTQNYDYYARAFAINQDGVSYGNVLLFTTGTISVMTEGNGTINKTTGETNPNGAIIFNGLEWVVNSTWAHKYFIDNTTGERLKEVDVHPVPSGATDSVFSIFRYEIERFGYSYSYPAKDSGEYIFDAIAYRIIDTITSREIILRSRGVGNGTGFSYFDIYIRDDITSGVPSLITTIRNDPYWFSYRGVDMEFALGQTSAEDSLTGEFPTMDGWYFLDVNNGADMGGKSYHFHTGNLDSVNSNTADLGSSYPVDFAIRYMDDYGNVKELAFTPLLLSEVYSSNTGTGNSSVNQDFSLMACPNPVRETTELIYFLSEPTEVNLCIYDETGKKRATLVDEFTPNGMQKVVFSPRTLGLTTGTYICRLSNHKNTRILKLIFIE